MVLRVSVWESNTFSADEWLGGVDVRVDPLVLRYLLLAHVVCVCVLDVLSVCLVFVCLVCVCVCYPVGPVGLWRSS